MSAERSPSPAAGARASDTWRRPDARRGVQRVVGPAPTHKREALRMSDGLDCKIDVEVGPVEMPRAGKLNIQDLADRRLAEP